MICNPSDFKVALHDVGLDYEKISAFDLFCIMHKFLTLEITKIFLGDLNLSKLELCQNNETKEVVLHDFENDISIDQKTFEIMSECVRRISGYEKCVNTVPQDEKLKQILIDKERYELEIRMNYKPILFPFLCDIDGYRNLRLSTLTMFLNSHKCCEAYISSI